MTLKACHPPEKQNLKRGMQNVWPRIVFNFREELLSYCPSDVRLLKEGCTKFATEFQQLAGFNLFEHCVTITSACNRFFQKTLFDASDHCLRTHLWLAS